MSTWIGYFVHRLCRKSIKLTKLSWPLWPLRINKINFSLSTSLNFRLSRTVVKIHCIYMICYQRYTDLEVFKGTWYTRSPKTPIFYVLPDIFIKPRCIKNLNELFWPRVHRWEKWSQSGKMPPGGRSEIENDKYAKNDIFNFNSATKWRFWSFTPLLLSMVHCPKKCHLNFWYVEY